MSWKNVGTESFLFWPPGLSEGVAKEELWFSCLFSWVQFPAKGSQGKSYIKNGSLRPWRAGVILAILT